MDPRARRLGFWARSFACLGALAIFVVLGTAWRLDPDPRGYGTHEQLGLPPCTFRATTGRPCPSCGLTTAFAESARGRFASATRANPAGALLFLASLIGGPWLLHAGCTGKTLGSRTLEFPVISTLVAAVALLVVAWFLRGFVLGGG
jgi:hypothetical protein